MSLPILWSNLKASWGTFLAWGLGLFAYGIVIVEFYDWMKDSLGAYQAILESMPEEFKALIGVGEGETGSLFSLQGGMTLEAYLSTEYLTWWPALLAIFAIFAGVGIAAREVERGTMDLLLSQPVRRYQVVATKFAVFLLGTLAIALLSFLGVVLGLAINAGTVNQRGLLFALLQGGLLLAAIGGYTTFFSCLFLEPRRAFMASGLLTGGLYVLNFMGPSLGDFQWLQRLSLFHYFKVLPLVRHAQVDGTSVIIYLTVAAVSLLASLIVFENRDIA